LPSAIQIDPSATYGVPYAPYDEGVETIDTGDVHPRYAVDR
jgi:hypothetical protein